MRRTDRLFDLIQILRDGRLHRAADLALRVGVSDRTVWRDMATLMASGMPVEGERGVGYILRAPITLPPMILTPAEREALRSGLRQVAQGSDEVLARAARSLADKISAATPLPVDDPNDLFATPARSTPRAARHLPLIRHA
ncbi:MAG: HTH domain-containing protein, partial [Paracoccaceae bacterium]